jgi:hypothetical protein
MSQGDDRVTGVFWLGLPLVAMIVGELMILPPRLALVGAVWVLISLPVGIAVGHCALGEIEPAELPAT